MTKESIFITGASGCVGHYVVDQLKNDYKLYLLVRNPAKLKNNPEKFDDITIIQEDLDNISQLSELLSKMDYCIHIATAWGGENTEKINVQRTHELFNLLNRDKLKRVIYFSTASILGRDMEVLEEAEKYGTDYIRTKSISYQKLPELKLSDKIITVFPTLVFGGDNRHPLSHLTRGIPKLKRFSWFIGHVNLDIAFHFIHAEDIAKMVKYLLKVSDPEEKYVLGNPEINFGELSKRAARYFGRKIHWQLKIKPEYLYNLLKLFRVDVSKWDEFCIEYKNFVYPVINCPSLGLKTNFSTIEDIISHSLSIKAN